MNHHRTFVLVLAMGAALAAGCGDDASENEDPAGATALLRKIQDQNYRGWARAPGWKQRMPTTAPHGTTVDIYVNDVVEGALDGPAIDAWPEGSIIAKDGWNGEQLKIVAIMEKSADGWFWAELSGAGEPEFSGRPATCTDCHSSGSDFVRAFKLPGAQ